MSKIDTDTYGPAAARKLDLPDQDYPTTDGETADSVEKNRHKHAAAAAAADPSSPQPTASQAAAAPPFSPPPNGGLSAWLQVAGSFMVFFNTWGLLNTFGVFQTYYESGALFHESASNISWIGSLQAFFVLLGGLFSGPLYDKGYLRSLLIVGSFLIVFGHMMLSLSSTYWQTLLSQGFCVGLGAGMLFTPAISVIPTYFSSRVGLALGLSAAGSSFGGVIYPIVFYRLISQIGFRWSVRVIGFIALATLLVPIAFLRQRVRPARARAMLDMTAFTDWPYVVFTLGCFLGFVGLYVELLFLSFYGQATGTTDASMSFYIVPILNAASMFGRTLPNWLSDKTGGLNLIIPGALICGVLVLCMQVVHSLGSIVVIALLFGFFSGVFIALPPVLFVALTEDKSRIGTRIGMGFAFLAFGVLAGGPGAGGVLGQKADDLDWTGLWIYGGVAMIASSAVLLGVRIWKYGFKLMVKA